MCIRDRPYSEIIEEDYVPTEADEIALLATTYSQLRFVMDWYGSVSYTHLDVYKRQHK